MKADLTRNTFHPFKHFTRVLMQQGRVQLDADWNEQAAILATYLRELGADIIGPCGGPSDNLGFAPFVLSPDPANPAPFDFGISAGHFYVDGILCENSHDYAAFVLPTPLANNSITFTPDRPELDGTLIQVGDFLELFDATATFNPLPAIVTKVSVGAITVTVNTTSLSKWGSNAQPRVRRLITYAHQPDNPMSKSDLGGQQATVTLLAYLDVWERLITCVEDDSIREVALGGPDTAARAKLVAQVKWTTPPAGAATDQRLKDVVTFLNNRFQPRNRGLLKARVTPTAASTDPCIISPDSNYRGPENQLYRVEIHTGTLNADGTSGTQPPTFTWSRENGSPVFPILLGGGTNVVTLETLGRDDRFGLAEGDWVEVEDDDYVLQNRAGTLLQVVGIDRTTMQVTLSGSPDPNVGNKPEKHPLLRRWDQQEGDETTGGLQLGADNAALIKVGTWLNLEDGVQVLFFDPDPNNPQQYRSGDYWLIPARVATGNVEWPTVQTKDAQGNPVNDQVPLPPLGITHHYAPLATISVDPKGPVTVSGAPPSFDHSVNPIWP